MDEVIRRADRDRVVLCGVFIPTRSFRVYPASFTSSSRFTIVSATAISAFVSLTLSPAIAAMLLNRAITIMYPPRDSRYPARFARGFNNAFDKLSIATVG